MAVEPGKRTPPPKPFTTESAKAANRVKRERDVAAAAEARERFLGTIAGAKVRVVHVPRTLISETAFGVANYMLAQILTGQLVVNNAKDAATIAKLALDIGRLEIGDPTSNQGELTVEEREKRIEAAKMLRADLEARQAALEHEQRQHNEAADKAADEQRPSAKLSALPRRVSPEQ